MDSVDIADLAWPVYDDRVKKGAVVLIPVGALEQHGPHMSMNPDVLLPTAIARKVAQNIGGLVAPAIAYGYKSQQKSGGGNHMPGTTSLDGWTLTCVVRDVLRELARHGVRRTVMVNGHFENSAFLAEGIDLALRDLGSHNIKDFRCIVLSYWDFIDQKTIDTIYQGTFPGWAVEHGGVLETSLMLHLYPNLVNMDLVIDHPPATFPPYDFFPIKPEWTPSSGCLSSAKSAAATHGKLIFSVCVEGISGALRTAFD
ncbi:MAG: creatininase [Rhodanobacter sp.]|nr:MAG: creatininase [Rhodanobacter sp.]TAM05187.1 MAG: creatininase [Rhodanobacter sp.]TAM39574.1 MAG: creatininase [Rhodanobacter sp.]